MCANSRMKGSEARYRQCMYIIDKYPISKGKLLTKIKMYETGIQRVSFNPSSSRLNLG